MKAVNKLQLNQNVSQRHVSEIYCPLSTWLIVCERCDPNVCIIKGYVCFYAYICGSLSELDRVSVHFIMNNNHLEHLFIYIHSISHCNSIKTFYELM